MQRPTTAKVDGAVREADPWIQKIARVGYAAKGIVYVLVGTLAILPLFGQEGGLTSQQGAIDQIAQQPFGTFLLVAIGVGLFGYALWRLLQAAYNPEHKNVIKRVAYVVSAIAYGVLGYLSFRAVGGEQASQGNVNSGQVGLTAQLLEQPFGKLLVLALAAVFLVVGIVQMVNAWTTEYRKILDWGSMTGEEHATAIAAGKMGLFSRGVVFLILAWFLAKAAINENPAQAKGFAGALASLLDAPYGPWLFGLAALGLIAYGIFMFVLARYRRMVPVG